MTVYNFGSINIDHIYRVPHFVRPGETLASLSLDTVLGGKGANQSVALARAGTDVCHLGRLGEADLWARDIMADAGVNVSRIEAIAGVSGHALIQVDANGENCIVLHGGANQSIDESAMDAWLDGAGADDWLLMQNECNGAAAMIEAAAARGLSIAFNPAPMSDAVKAWPLQHCHLLVLNEVEAEGLSGEDEPAAVRRTLQHAYPDATLVLTLGARGAEIIAGDEHHTIVSPSVDVVDTTGAGDTFTGYCLAALIDGLPPADAVRRACAAAALSVTRAGAVPGIPDARAVDQFLSSAE